MNKKAFTLVEVMGVITVLGLISVLVAPTIINQIRNSKDKVDKVTEELIYSATDLYLDSRKSEYPKINNATYCIKLQEIVDAGRLNEPILNASGEEIDLNKYVLATVNSGNYNFKMSDTCAN